MAEAKNSFLKAKMNQDLDDRLLPNGEYRTAQNVLVGKSEEDSVGTLQNIKGNSLVSGTQLGTGVYGQIEIIGYYMDPTNNRIITFTTDWDGATNAPMDASCAVRSYSLNNASYNVLVEGSFLNFSQSNTIIAVSLLEDLLFWTDNRNQPRKINVETALREGISHYYKENHISVSKYNPYQAISLLKQEKESVISVTSTTVIEVAENLGIEVGMTVLGNRGSAETIYPYEYITVAAIEPSLTTGQIIVTLSSEPSDAIQIGDNLCFLISTMSDQADNPTWPGDPDYLEDKFVRFAYRFKFEDNEYSIYSPFTQIAFVPKQKGYFINGNENSALSSTIVDFFENNINNIELIIPLPDKGINISSSYKISEIDILYKESDALAVKVLDTVNVSSINNDENFYVYSYQSRKPIKTLPNEQTVRVFDKVPSKAFSQEIISNRVVYGNFLTKPTPPNSISYTVNFQPKIASCDYPSFIEYPNHNIKQNRNYQVGWVLSDKFGRQSSVILSPVEGVSSGTTGDFGGSTIYAEYIGDDPIGSGVYDTSFLPQGVVGWFGNSLVVQLNDPIAGGVTGLYATATGSGNGFVIDGSQPVTITDTTYTFTLSSGNDIPVEEEYLRGQNLDYVKITNVDSSNAPVYVVTTEDKVNDIYLPQQNLAPGLDDVKFAYNINPNGWYSYKIVVKQIEQEYYNVYLPGAFASGGLVEDSTDTDNTVSYVTLINDNINKIPRDLAEVGPDQKQYRSSVKLYGRVNPTVDKTAPESYTFGNAPFFPFRSSDTSTAVGNANDILGTSTNNKQLTGIVSNNGTGPNVTIKNFLPAGETVPRGAVIADTDMQNQSGTGPIPADTFVQSFLLLGERYPSGTGPVEDGMSARVILSNSVTAAVGNFINFTVRPGAYIFQGDSNPIIARISTNSQFGINYKDFELGTASDPEKRFQLSVYETDPFISALDIYWESAEYGLISDINEEVAVGYDGPTGLGQVGFSLFEDTPLNTNVTQTFYPVDQNGVEIPQTIIDSFSVEDGAGNVTTDGVLFSITQITSGPDLGAYQISTAAEFAYLYDSETTDVYTFTIVVENTNPSTDWAFQTLTFEGTLGNVDPDFTLPALPNYQVVQPATTPPQIIASLGSTTNPVNGSIDQQRETEDLIWSIQSGNSAGYFEIDPVLGNITLTSSAIANGIPFNTYPLAIKLQDASESTSGGIVEDNDSRSVTKSINLVAGYEQTNLPNPKETISANFALGCFGQSSMKQDFVLYLAKPNYNNLPAEFTFLPNNTFNLSIQKMGPELQRGEFVFSCENWKITTCTFLQPPADRFGFLKLEAYKRQTDAAGVVTGNWVAAPDLNGVVVQNAQSVSEFITLTTEWQNSSNLNYGGQTSYVAYGDPQFEYAFWARIENTTNGQQGAQFLGDFILRDLHYSGTNFEQIVYEFNDYSPFTFQVYADTPLHEYNLKYFTDPALLNQYEVNPPGQFGNNFTARLSKRLSSISSPGDQDLDDAQYDWGYNTNQAPVAPLQVYYMRGDAVYDINNEVDKTGAPPYVTTQKTTNQSGSGSWVSYTNSYPGPQPYDRNYDPTNYPTTASDFFV